MVKEFERLLTSNLFEGLAVPMPTLPLILYILSPVPDVHLLVPDCATPFMRYAPVMFTSPDTSSLYPGLAVPMPTLPVLSITIVLSRPCLFTNCNPLFRYGPIFAFVVSK